MAHELGICDTPTGRVGFEYLERVFLLILPFGSAGRTWADLPQLREGKLTARSVLPLDAQCLRGDAYLQVSRRRVICGILGGIHHVGISYQSACPQATLWSLPVAGRLILPPVSMAGPEPGRDNTGVF